MRAAITACTLAYSNDIIKWPLGASNKRRALEPRRSGGRGQGNTTIMTEQAEPTEQWRESAELLRVLGHPLRLALLADLVQGPRCVTDLQQLLNARQANISQHLAVLRQARLVDFREEGNTRCYYLRRPELVRALLAFLSVDYPEVPLSKEEIKRRAAQRGQ